MRQAGPEEPVLITCDRRTGKVLIAGGPPAAHAARLMADGVEVSYRLLRGGSGGVYLPVHSRSQLFDGVIAERRGLTVAFDTGQRSAIAPVRVVSRVVRECRSVAPTWIPLR